MTALHCLAVIHERNFGIPDSNDRFSRERTLVNNGPMTELRDKPAVRVMRKLGAFGPFRTLMLSAAKVRFEPMLALSNSRQKPLT